MFSLKEYREPTHRLPDLLPWAGLIAPGVILQKDGLLQKTIGFRGPDLLSSSPHELVQLNAQINHALMRLGSGWSFFVEAQRFRSSDYPEATWRHPAAWVADLERSRYFAEGHHFESNYYLTFVWQLPSDAANRLEGFFYEDAGGLEPESDSSKETAAFRRDLQFFRKTIAEVMTLLGPLLPSVAELGDDETLTYLHSCISTQRHPVRTPDIPLYLDALLADEAFTTGETPMLGEHFVLTSTISGFPSVTCPGILDALNHLQTEYRWATRFIALDKAEARKLIEGYRKKWTQRRKGILTMLKEQAAGGEESRLQNDSAIDKADDASQALRELGEDAVSFGYFTSTITVWDPDVKAAQQKRQLVKQAIQSHGFTVQDEGLNSREAWLSSLPGHVYANVRRPVVSTMNLAHMLPASSVWTGQPHNRHLAQVTGGVGLPHVLCTTTGATPFRLDLNVEDVGHTLILGPTGAGKSTLLAILGLQWMKYPKARVVIFDKDRSARAATLAMGGANFEPGNDRAPVAFQPFAYLDTEPERIWAAQFASCLFSAQGIEATPQLKEHLEFSLDSLQTRPVAERTLSTFRHILESFDPKYGQVLSSYCHGGNFGQIFDASADQVSPAQWTLIEMGHLMQMGPAVIVPALFYLFRRVEQQFTGDPTLLILDEAWLFLSHPVFAERLQAWLKTLRKKNVFVVFATQEVADASRNVALQSTILSACATKIFLADPEAMVPAMAADYEKLGLTPAEIQNLSRMSKKRDYYLRSTAGRRIFTLALGPAQLTFAGMSGESDHRFLDRMVATRAPHEYAEAMLEHRGVDWAAAALRQQRSTHAPRSPARRPFDARGWSLAK
jgi:type IV secretion/conjugal transfer VirB4 family ATPase